MNSTVATRRPGSAKRSLRAAQEDPMRVPLLLWAAVLLSAMLTIYVQLVLSQVARGERLREEQRARAEVTTGSVAKRQASADARGARPFSASRRAAPPA